MNCDLRYNGKNPKVKQLSQVQKNNKGDRRQRFKESVILFLLVSAFAFILLCDFLLI